MVKPNFSVFEPDVVKFAIFHHKNAQAKKKGASKLISLLNFSYSNRKTIFSFKFIS